MAKLQALTEVLGTYGGPATDEPESRFAEHYRDEAETDVEAYAEVQREFGWDDTH